MNSNQKVIKENNDSQFFLKYLKIMGLRQSTLTRLLGCSNVVNYWATGYRVIPKSFRRFMLVLRFIHELDLMPQLLQYIEHHEKEGWGSPVIKGTNWLKLNSVVVNSKKRKRKC